MTTRKLLPEEWFRISSIVHDEFSALPPRPNTSLAVVAEEDGEIVGLLVLQPVWYVGPVWVKDSWRGRFIVSKLVERMHELVPRLHHCFTTTTQPRLGRLFERLGMRKVDWTVYRWLRKEQVNERKLVRTGS